MSDWLIQDGGKSKPITESELRARLRDGKLTGVELVRPPRADAWAPLHDLPLFSEEVAHTGDPRRVAQRRLVAGFAWHGGTFLALMIFLGFPWWGIFWGIGVLAHAARALPAAYALLAAPRAVTSAAPAATLPAPTSDSSSDSDPFLQRLEELLGGLVAQGEDVAVVRSEARQLHARRLALEEALAGVDLAALEAELAIRRSAVRGAESEQDAEAYGREAEALAGRLSSAQEAARARERLAAQERELLHKLESVRLALAQRAVAAEGDAGAGARAQLAEVQERLAAEGEIDEHLAAARRAAARQPQRR